MDLIARNVTSVPIIGCKMSNCDTIILAADATIQRLHLRKSRVSAHSHHRHGEEITRETHSIQSVPGWCHVRSNEPNSHHCMELGGPAFAKR
jgi:hypothetical protein